MALNFDATTEKVVVTDTTDIQNQAEWTCIFWFRPTTQDANFRTVMAKTANMFITVSNTGGFGGAGSLRVKRNYSGSNLDYYVSSVFTVNEWNFAAVVLEDIATSPAAGEFAHLYVGDLNTTVTERTPTSTADPSGTLTGDSGTDMTIGQFGANNLNYLGDIANFHFIRRARAFRFIREQQFRSRARLQSRIKFEMGWDGTSTVYDMSGYQNDGTITGCAQADHVPLGPFLGFDMPPSLVPPAPAPSVGQPTMRRWANVPHMTSHYMPQLGRRTA